MTPGAPAGRPGVPAGLLEAFVVGRIGVDLTPPTPRTSLAAADSFIRSVGGFAGNIAFGLARQGVSTAVLSSVGADGHGAYVRAALAGEGIDVSGLATRPTGQTQVAFFEVWPPDDFPVTFYRSTPGPRDPARAGRPAPRSPRARPAGDRVGDAPRQPSRLARRPSPSSPSGGRAATGGRHRGRSSISTGGPGCGPTCASIPP